MKPVTWLVLALLLAMLNEPVLAQQAIVAPSPAELRYLSPSDGSPFVPPGTTLALRLDGPINPHTLSPSLFSLVGSSSGPHVGQVRLADDGATVVFEPNIPFTFGERVMATVKAGLATQAGEVFAGSQTSFNISAGGASAQALSSVNDELASATAAGPTISAPANLQSVAVHPQDYVTFPHDFPAYTVTVPASVTAPGLLFMAPFPLAPNPSFLFITDDKGEPVFWQRAGSGGATLSAFDFKRQPDGTLTYFNGSDLSFHVLDSTYSETKVITAANGYTTDLHDLQILPNGHALFMADDPEITNTVQYGGVPTATVVGLIIQELDTNGLPVFQWDSWSHFAISDTYLSLASTYVDYVHGNAIGLDTDNNILLSSRHMSEITKIDHGDGHIIWRLGGKNNQFAINDPDGPFACQHDIRRLANGDLTIFDNHNPGACATIGIPFSRAVEYQIDEIDKVVTNTWQYRNTPEESSFATGDVQRLPDGHTLIDWGFGHPNVTEVLTDGTKLFEMNFDPAYFSYRVFRFPWAAVPAWAPTLVLTGSTPTLYYSWNGATDVASYEIYGGFGSQPQTLVATQPRTGFEDHTALTGLPPNLCAYRVRPIDHDGQPQTFSNVVYTRTPCTGQSDLGVTKSVSSGSVPPGQTLTYTLVLSNTGPDLVPTARLTDVIPANLVAVTYTSSGAALTPVGSTPYAWDVTGLAPGSGGIITVTGVLSGGRHGTVFTNTAILTADSYTDTNPADNNSGVSVRVANVAPVAAGAAYTMPINSILIVPAPGLLADTSDTNNDPLIALLDTGPLTGNVGLNADGSFIYVPPLGFAGPITFTYRASDGQLLSAPAVVAVAVRPYKLILPNITR